MSIFAKIVSGYRDGRRELSMPESIETLDLIKEHFDDGRNWTQNMYETPNGAHCIVGAADHVRVSSLDDAKHYLLLAINEVAPGVKRIEEFNDTRRNFSEVAAVIDRARQIAVKGIERAQQAAAQSVALRPAPVIEILPPPVRVRSVRTRSRPDLATWIMD